MIRQILSFLAVCLLTTPLVAAPAGVTVNGVDVSEGSGEGWTYANTSQTLTLSGVGPFTLSGTNTSGSVLVSVQADMGVTFSNLVLRTTTSNKCAFDVVSGSFLRIGLAGANELTSGPYCAGLQVAGGASVWINEAVGSPGASLKVQGGSQGGAGLGGKRRAACGSIFIESGRVMATGGDMGAGIGGGWQKAAEIVSISGGTVVATAGENAKAIGTGKDATGGAVAITGGSVHAVTIQNEPTNAVGQVLQCVTVLGLEPHAAVTVTGLGGYGTNGIVADEKGRIYLWLPGTASDPVAYRFSANGTRYEATVKGAATTAVVAGHLEPTGVLVDGADVGLSESGAGWSYSASAHEIALTGVGPFVVSGANTAESLEIGSAVGSRVKFRDFASGNLSLKGPLEIVGGTVAAQAVRGAAIITGGSVNCSSFELAPSNGTERVWCVTVTNLVPGSVVRPSGLMGYDVEDIVADAVGRIYLWLPNGDRIFTVDGRSLRAIVDEADVFAEPVPDVVPTGVTVNGIDAAYGHGAGWAYANPTLTLSEEGPFALSGTNELGAVRVVVQANATVVASNLVLTMTAGAPCAIDAPHALTLVLAGTNSFASGESAGLDVREGAAVTIQGKVGGGGFLKAVGGGTFPGIGGEYDEENLATISIQGGTVVAVGAGSGKRKAPDIGGDALSYAYGLNPTVTITGGSIKAETIANAPVDAEGRLVHCVTVTNLVPGSVVRPSGLTGYGVDGIVVDATGRIYLWLPNGTHRFTIGGFRYEATVTGAAVTATCVGPAVVAPSWLEVASIAVVDGVARLGISTDLGAEDFAAWLESATFEVDFRTEPAGTVTQTLTPTRKGSVLSVTLPSTAWGFLTVRAR